MLSKALDFILGREPVITATGLAGLVTAAFGLLHAFDVLRLTPEQVAAVGTFLAVVAGWAARQAVSPVVGQTERQISRLKTELKDEAGGLFAGLAIGFAVVFLILFAFCTVIGTESDERGMAPVELADNSPCEGDCSGRQKRGCADAQAPCSDDDLNGNRVIVCLPQSECHFEKETPT